MIRWGSPEHGGGTTARRAGTRPALGALAGLVGALLGALPVAAAPARYGAPAGCASPVGVHTAGTPWAIELLGPRRVWPLSTGSGVRTAVLGTGVDARNAQFRPGQVEDGRDVLDNSGVATDDCDGRGTFAAGLIAARPHDDTTFAGLAPGVSVLPVRYTQSTTQGNGAVDPDRLAAAIDVAVTARARVIYVVLPATRNTAQLRAATARAIAADIVVVSPATSGPRTQGATSYPTALPGVLAVGAFGPDGAVASTESGDHIGVSAPGRQLLSLSAGANGRLGHSPTVDDPAYAAAYVAGTAALLRSYRPELSAAEVVRRITSTAQRTAVAGHHPQLGWGMVDPYRAVAAEGVEDPPAVAAASAQPVAAAGADRGSDVHPVVLPLASAGLVAALLVGIGTAVTRRGRARGWRPGG
ncbi:Subtilase family protein [Micromonospora pallida]|uniref:Subtilase family protein n=1 Tax=Micromonospora pallida TaxID=145854 RepID=A0A1C6RVC7_9ACTN|nr:S8 family serine peptidase [Micromonospora pallida]SCL20970.1 Subtilase family protein [Micromonospora pallida]